MSYIGIIGAKRLDDSNASLGLIEAQKKAVQLLRCSTDMHMIKQQTGWEMGVDGKWRYEVADPFHNTVEIEDHLKRHFGESINISLCMHDISLLIAYPAFERLSFIRQIHTDQQVFRVFQSFELRHDDLHGNAKFSVPIPDRRCVAA